MPLPSEPRTHRPSAEAASCAGRSPKAEPASQVPSPPRPEVRLPEALETPALAALLRYWYDAAGVAGGLPDRRVFDALRLGPWLGRLTVFGVLPDGDWQVRLDGTDIVAETGIDWTDLRVSEVERRYPIRIAADLHVCTHTGGPIAQRLNVYNEDHRSAERVLLPIRAADGTVQVFLALYPV